MNTENRDVIYSQPAVLVKGKVGIPIYSFAKDPEDINTDSYTCFGEQLEAAGFFIDTEYHHKPAPPTTGNLIFVVWRKKK